VSTVVAPITAPSARRPILRSVGAVAAGVMLNAVAALAIDQLFHALGVYPAWGEPMPDAGDNLLALSYRIVLGVVGGYLVARLAPRSPMRHALAYGAVGVVLSGLGVVAATQVNLGPLWYPLLLMAVSLPCGWLGGTLFRRRAARR
jgi:hypothetical protein